MKKPLKSSDSTPPLGEEDITSLLLRCQDGDAGALAILIPRVFEDLRRLARYHFREERAGHTLQPTALVSELYLRLVGTRLPQLLGRKEFFTVASRLMREILVDHARSRGAQKRGGGMARISLQEALDSPPRPGLDTPGLLAVHGALESLNKIDAEQAQLAELRFFTGLTIPEAADVMGISRATAERRWRAARRWLAFQLQ
ncbi:MAG: sigma-70 family RNA polymerase sigma factor [Deltaproteobacteria bacterium]|nr:sigma-70 family RNA polymerase sigma factor [Deltaproteobacteria bacterium]